MLFCSCGKDRAGVTISLGETNVKLGREMNLRVDHAPDGWYGEILVNNLRHFAIDPKHHSLRVTSKNGFDPASAVDLFVLLLDRNGREIPLANHGHLLIRAVPAATTLSPDSDTVPSGGGSGAIRISAAADGSWSVKNLPEWMKISPSLNGSGSGTITYDVAANTSNQDRSAAIEIGDAIFEVTQLALIPRDSSFHGPRDTSGQRVTGVSSTKSRLPMAKVTLDKSALKLSEEIQIRVEQVPEHWSGELMVNSLRLFVFNSKLYRLKATVANGFNPEGPTDLNILLTDSKGYGIPVANEGRFRIEVKRGAVSLDRDSRNVEPGGTWGQLSVTANAGYHWSVGGAPEWIRITGAEGSGNGTFAYSVDENTTNETRSATLTVGDASFEVSQLHPLAIQIPFRDTFLYSAPPPNIGTLVHLKNNIESPVRWVLDEQPGIRSTLSIQAEAPKGGNSLLIEKHADPRSWATQVVLPDIQVKDRESYKVSAWMKTENPGLIWIGFGQRSAPYGPCGLAHVFWVSKVWTEYAAPFRVTGAGCDATNNRLSIQVGQIGGKLWIADFSLTSSR